MKEVRIGIKEEKTAKALLIALAYAGCSVRLEQQIGTYWVIFSIPEVNIK